MNRKYYGHEWSRLEFYFMVEDLFVANCCTFFADCLWELVNINYKAKIIKVFQTQKSKPDESKMKVL